MSNKYIAVVIVALILVGGGSFYGGMQYNKSVTAQARVAARAGFAGAGNGQGGAGQNGGMRRGGQGGGGFVAGEILSKDDKSLTIKTADGGSTIVYFSPTVLVRKAEVGSLTDLATGQQVVVNGKSNADGSLSADTVQITPKTNQ